ncbi:CinA family protein [Actinokineospora iranica]|uniref:Nicotinamide-nucleotide amidase n=1 Tax=Actinokineospora iranica TaxID=1271860 RepID=A0A1G6KJS2_9PSEU|nr:CinA family protein [Actinokineospora iranica]SDC30566.1 nicotinamide-nucleotide amidase [Actinokineospora iranica]
MTALALVPGLPAAPVAALVEALRTRGETVATAESLTAGLLTAVLTSVPGSSAVVRGGLVVYATDLKTTLAGVPAALLAERGAVDPEVAVHLAHGARDRCGASIGVGLTGVAGPDPQGGVAAGTAHVALAGRAGVRTRVVAEPGGRAAVRAAAVRAALELIAGELGTLFE